MYFAPPRLLSLSLSLALAPSLSLSLSLSFSLSLSLALSLSEAKERARKTGWEGQGGRKEGEFIKNVKLQGGGSRALSGDGPAPLGRLSRATGGDAGANSRWGRVLLAAMCQLAVMPLGINSSLLYNTLVGSGSGTVVTTA